MPIFRPRKFTFFPFLILFKRIETIDMTPCVISFLVLPYMGKGAIWSCDQHYIHINSFPCTSKLKYKFWPKKVKWFLRKTSFNFDM